MSEWKVSSNIFGDKKVYSVYKTLNINEEVDHTGNRKTYGFFDSKEEAEELVKKLNEVN